MRAESRVLDEEANFEMGLLSYVVHVEIDDSVLEVELGDLRLDRLPVRRLVQ